MSDFYKKKSSQDQSTLNGAYAFPLGPRAAAQRELAGGRFEGSRKGGRGGNRLCSGGGRFGGGESRVSRPGATKHAKKSSRSLNPFQGLNFPKK